MLKTENSESWPIKLDQPVCLLNEEGPKVFSDWPVPTQLLAAEPCVSLETAA